MSKHRIRSARSTDYEGVCDMFRLLDAIHIELYPDLFHHYPQASRGWEDYQATLADPSRILLLAEGDDNRLLGFAAMLIAHSSQLPAFRPIRFALLDNFFVREELRGTGLAESLFDAARDWSLSQGVTKMRLKTYDKNQRAIRFYEKLGFEPLTHDYQLDIT